MRRVAAAAAAVLVLLIPASANGSTASVDDGVLVYEADGGEQNLVTITQSGSTLSVSDEGVLIEAVAPECVGGGAVGAAVTCTAPNGFDFMEVLTGDLGDTVTLPSVDVPAEPIDGGPGADVINGGVGDDLIDGGIGGDSLSGGSGTDLASYAGRAGDVWVDWVFLGHEDGEGCGGLIGCEGDDLDEDFEGVIGGDGDDSLGGDNDTEYIFGGPGDDALVPRGGDDYAFGGPGDDELREFELTNGGADELDGGEGIDTVDYHSRSTPIVADPGGGPNDGADTDGDWVADEGDDIDIDVENLIGGPDSDLLIGSTAVNFIQPYDAGNGEVGADLIDVEDGAFDTVGCPNGDVPHLVFADTEDEVERCAFVDRPGPPETTIRDGALSGETAYFFDSSEAGSTFECSLDGAAFTFCDDTFFPNLEPDGPHRLLVTAVDPGGEADPSPAERMWSTGTMVKPPRPPLHQPKTPIQPARKKCKKGQKLKKGKCVRRKKRK